MPTRHPARERAEALCSRMTLEEKISRLSTPAPAIPRLGMPAYNWHGECLHGLVHTGRATIFPQSIAMAATFNPRLIRQVADAIASEARAKRHDPAWHGPDGPRVGLNFWTPNINILRDPRWGRSQETYGEDPLLTGTIGAGFVKGLQGDDPVYLKTAACAKHFAVHSGPENLRARFDARVSKKELFESYLPAFKMLIDAGVESVMAAYNRVNGEPCPASTFLLTGVLRTRWRFGGHVVSDGGAVSAIHNGHRVTASPAASAAAALRSGCDLCNEGNSSYAHLPEALEKGLITESEIDAACIRMLTTEFKLGLYDPPEQVAWTRIPPSVIGCRRHRNLARKTAEQSMVLLKNTGILPLGPSHKTVAVVGPTAADMEVLLGNFYRGTAPRLSTILEGITGAAPEGTAVTYLPGAYPAHRNVSDSGWHKGLAEQADVVVAVVGLTPLMEGEAGECIGSEGGGDRLELTLPAHQVDFVDELAALGKPLVLVVTGGCSLTLGPVAEKADAVLYAWYPGEEGGIAAGNILFGRCNPSGRLPVTVYRSRADLPPFDDYRMEGRTYRFMQTEPEFPFGFGLSYTSFSYHNLTVTTPPLKPGNSLRASVTVKNTGSRKGDEVVQWYLRPVGTTEKGAGWTLAAFSRITLSPGQQRRISCTLPAATLMTVSEEGTTVWKPGRRELAAAGALPIQRSRNLGAAAPCCAQFSLGNGPGDQ